MRYLSTTIRVPHFKWINGERVTTKADSVGLIKFEIDEDAIMQQIGRKALLSRSGRSIALGGLIKAKRQRSA